MSDIRPHDTLLRWLVPSSTRENEFHLVDLGEGICSCEDHQFRGVRCKHFGPAEEMLLRYTIDTLKRNEQKRLHP